MECILQSKKYFSLNSSGPYTGLVCPSIITQFTLLVALTVLTYYLNHKFWEVSLVQTILFIIRTLAT